MFQNIAIDNNALKDEPTLNRLTSKAHELQQPIQDRIERHIDQMQGIMPTLAGAPGAHAEVRLVNSIVALYPGRAERMLTDAIVFTDTLSRGSTPQSFPACINCSGIIPEEVNIPTGRNPPDYRGYNTHVRQINETQRTRAAKRPWNRR
jgi:insecticidal toxin complex protein TccC